MSIRQVESRIGQFCSLLDRTRACCSAIAQSRLHTSQLSQPGNAHLHFPALPISWNGCGMFPRQAHTTRHLPPPLCINMRWQPRPLPSNLPFPPSPRHATQGSQSSSLVLSRKFIFWDNTARAQSIFFCASLFSPSFHTPPALRSFRHSLALGGGVKDGGDGTP